MKKNLITLALICAMTLTAFCACAPKTSTLTTVENLGDCTLSIVYTFNDSALTSVTQTAVYTEKTPLQRDSAMIEAMEEAGYFTDVSITDTTIACTLTDTGIEKYHPNATMDSLIEDAKSSSIEWETSQSE